MKRMHLAALLLSIGSFMGGSPAVALQFDVTTTADSGPGSLRQALLDAATIPGPDEVVVQPGLGLITLSSALVWRGLAIDPVTIRGNGVRLDFAGASRGLVDDGGDGVTIFDMEITGVGGSIDNDTAPVLSQGGEMLLERCTITGNTVTTTEGDSAGGVLSEGGSVTLRNCTITGNTVSGVDGDAAGGVLSEGGSVTLEDCTITGNSASGDADAGGGVVSEGGPIVLRDCTISGNSADTSDGDGCGGVLSEGGAVDVTDCVIEGNTGRASDDAGGGIQSEGGDVTVVRSTVNCNQATTTGAERTAAGGLLSDGGAVAVTDSTFLGNRATASGSESQAINGIFSSALPAPTLTNTTVSDQGPCGPPAIESYFLPKKVKAKVNAADAAKSSLIAVGIIDTGPGVANLASAAQLDVGGFHFDVPNLQQKGKVFTLSSGGTTFTVKPNPFGSSRAKFRLLTIGDFTGKVALTGPLSLHFANAVADGIGTVKLGGGKYVLGKVRGALVAPNLYVARARATLKGPGDDALAIVIGLATDGTTPATASEVKIGFGERLSATIPASSFTRKGDQYVFKGNVGGITKVVVDYVRETISITGKGLDLGSFAQGGNAVLITVGLGADERAVRVRMGRKGATMKY